MKFIFEDHGPIRANITSVRIYVRRDGRTQITGLISLRQDEKEALKAALEKLPESFTFIDRATEDPANNKIGVPEHAK